MNASVAVAAPGASRARPTRPPRRRMAATEFSSRSRTRSTQDHQCSSRPRPRAGSHTEDGGSRSRWRAERSLVATALEHERQLDEPAAETSALPAQGAPWRRRWRTCAASGSRGIASWDPATCKCPLQSGSRRAGVDVLAPGAELTRSCSGRPALHPRRVSAVIPREPPTRGYEGSQ